MSNSSKLITLRSMVRDLPRMFDSLCNEGMTRMQYRAHLFQLFEEIDDVLRSEGSLTPTQKGSYDQETEEAITTLRVARRHRNSTCFQGGDFDFYLSCQDPWGNFPGQSGWGVL